MGKAGLSYRGIAWRIITAGLLLLTMAGCAGTAGSANNSDNDKNSGFYSGVSGGWSHP